MGNSQTSEAKSAGGSKHPTKSAGVKVKSLIKIKGKRSKILDTAELTGIVPSDADDVHNIDDDASNEYKKPLYSTDNLQKSHIPPQTTTNNDHNLMVTDSWCKANRITDETEKVTPESASSESNFTDPLTPSMAGLTIDNNYHNNSSQENVDLDVVEVPAHSTHENFLLDLTLNSFKLNDYRARHEEEQRDRKLSKLGVSKTSQISLDSDPRDSFASENIEIVRNSNCDTYGVSDRDVGGEGTLKRKQSEPSDEDCQKIGQMVKRTSDNNLTTGNNGIPEYKRHMSVPAELTRPNTNSLILQKVASLTLSKVDLESKISKPRFVPEKLDFQLYEKFEGHMLVNWYLSEFNEDHHLLQSLNGHRDLKLLAVQFCTHLLAAGVLRQIPDKNVPICNIFKPDCMYYWTHAETPLSVPQTPGRLSMISWPPISPSEVFLSPMSNANEGIDSTTARTPGQQSTDNVLMAGDIINKRYEGLKNSARDVEILSLEEEINRLKQEVEKYQTYIEIQTLTSNAVNDFESPVVDNDKSFISNNKSSCDNNVNKIVQTDSDLNLVSDSICKNNATTQTDDKNSNDSEAQFDQAQSRFIKCSTVATQTEDQTQILTPSNVQVPQTQDNSTNTDPAQIESDIISKSEDNDSSSLQVQNIPPPPPPPSLLEPETIQPPPPPPPPPMIGVGDSIAPPVGGVNAPPPPPPLPIFGAAGPPPPPPLPPMLGVAGLPPPPPLPPMFGGVNAPPAPPPPLPGLGVGPPPPPPLGGPASLPVPPAGGWTSQKAVGPPAPVYLGLRKSTLNPAVPMKPLYWTRIIAPPSAQCEETTDGSGNTKSSTLPLWTQIDELPLDSLNEFADLFSRQVVTRKPTIKKQEQKAKVEAVKLLDSKRSQNVGILAQSLHIDFQEIENAIYNFDTSIVSLEALQQIYEVRATAEELDLIKNHLNTKPEIPLDKPEQFLYELSEISNFAERISCLMFQVEFDDLITTIGNTLTNIKTTCEYLINSDELKEVLAIILTLGNYMNGGNMSRGQADGFGLEILSKLKDVKSKDSKTTLLHYIVQMYMKKIENPFEPNVTLPVPEPGDIKRAATVNFDDVKVDLQKLLKQLEECDRRTIKVIESSTPDNLQPFKDKMTSFIDSSKKQLKIEFENLEECKRNFISTMQFYLFKPKSGTLDAFPPNSFFELWLSFCVDFKDIFKRELIRLEKEKLQKIKKKEIQQRSEIVKIKKPENGLKSKFQARMKEFVTS